MKRENVTTVELKTPVQVVNASTQDMIEAKTVVIRFLGRKGAVILKKLESKVFQSLQKMAGSSTKKVKDEKDEKPMTEDDVLIVIDVSGAGSEVFEGVLDAIKAHGTIEGMQITNEILDRMEVEDLNAIYEKVVRDFLSKGVIRTLNKSTND